MKPVYPTLLMGTSFCRFGHILFSLFFITGMHACTKNLPDCNGNCTTVVFSGKVTNLSTGQPIKNVPIKVYLFPDREGLFYVKPDILAASGKTKSDGTFSFSPEIDLKYFSTYTTGINAYIPDGYLQSPATATESGFQKPDDYDSHTFYHVYDSAGFRSLDYGFYEQAKLQVHIHRTSAYTPDSLVIYNFTLGSNGSSSGAALTESATNKDTTVSVLTAANIYTVVTRMRSIPAGTGPAELVKDSVRCTKEGPNAIDVYY